MRVTLIAMSSCRWVGTAEFSVLDRICPILRFAAMPLFYVTACRLNRAPKRVIYPDGKHCCWTSLPTAVLVAATRKTPAAFKITLFEGVMFYVTSQGRACSGA